VFSRCARHPVTDDAYWTVRDGGLWPDAPPAIAKSNLPLSQRAAFAEELAGEKSEAERWLKSLPAGIDSQPLADRAINWAARIGEIERKAEAARKREKQPFLDEARSVDEEWKPVVVGAGALKRALKDACEAFLVAERKKADEARRAAAEAAAQGAPVVPFTLPRGKAGTASHVAGVRTVKTAKIVNYEAALAYFANAEEIRELVQTLADRAVRAGIVPAGCELQTGHKVT
jgi:glycosyltransferase involved in cell wall biosynthesis